MKGFPFSRRSRVEHVASLAERIEADLARELVRLKSLQKPVRRSPRIKPRYAA